MSGLSLPSIFSLRSEGSNLEASEVPSLLRWCFHPSQPESSSANTAAATFKFKNFHNLKSVLKSTFKTAKFVFKFAFEILKFTARCLSEFMSRSAPRRMS